MQQEPVLEETNNWAESTAMTIYCIRLSVQWISGLTAKDDIGTFLIMKSKTQFLCLLVYRVVAYIHSFKIRRFHDRKFENNERLS